MYWSSNVFTGMFWSVPSPFQDQQNAIKNTIILWIYINTFNATIPNTGHVVDNKHIAPILYLKKVVVMKILSVSQKKYS